MSNRISFFLPSLSGGGAERVIVTLASHLADSGIDVDLVLISKSGPYLDEVSGKVRVIDLQARRALTSVLPLVRYLRATRPRAMLSTLMHANIIAACAVRLAGIDTRLVIRESNSLSATHLGSGFKVRLKFMLARWAYRQADILVGVSEGSRSMMYKSLNLPRSIPGKVIYNPVVDETLRGKSKLCVMPDWPWRHDDAPVVIGVGRLVPQKDFATLLQAFSIVRQSTKARLIILGEGEERASLTLLADRLGMTADVWMPGFVKNPFAHMAKASVYVLSSRWEGLPNTLVQAMACGTPVVATRCPSGPEEILQNGLWGKLISVADAPGMAAAILDTLKHRATPLPAEALEKYDVAHVARQYLTTMTIGG